ncbi:MAG: peroxide stress protein YaaA [Lachnospiraceae bacterium]|nr:peroxide stress protein YaaA [Lachnospiraceae bacterium]
MKIIISPAKKMNIDQETYPVQALPKFLSETEKILEWMKQLSYDEAKQLWNCNDKLVNLNFRRVQEMELERNLTPAICSYEGIQYQYMAPLVFTQKALSYVQEHLRIISGFYGLLRPLDGVVPYRLEMQAKLENFTGGKDLYQFWGDKLYRNVVLQDRIILNLASKEYSRCIENYLENDVHFVTCVFGEKQKDKIVQKGTLAKMARGEMVRFLAENEVEDLKTVKSFRGLDYFYSEADSTEWEYVFLKKAVSRQEKH